MERPAAAIEGCRGAHARLAEDVEHLTEPMAREASLLPGWTVAHVLTHLARNAEAMVRRVEATQRGEAVDQYVGGAEGRAAEIAAGANRPIDELIDDVLRWSRRLDETFSSLPEVSWARPVRSIDGAEHPVVELPFRRWREVEIHLVDLGIGIGPDNWSQELVDLQLPRLIAGLAERADHRSLMAWLLVRGPAPELEPWG